MASWASTTLSVFPLRMLGDTDLSLLKSQISSLSNLMNQILLAFLDDA